MTTNNIDKVYKKFNIPLYVYEYDTCEFINNSLNIERNSDKQCFEFLEIELNPNIDVSDFKNIFHKISLILKIGDVKIIDLPFRFMMSLQTYEIVDNKFYLSIPFEMFCDDIILICCLKHCLVNISLLNAENIFLSCKLILKKTYINTPERSDLYNQSMTVGIKTFVQNLSLVELNFKNSRNEFSCDLECGLYKGFFIESECIDEINEIKLIDNKENTIRIYNSFLIKKKCIKISQNLLYFPMNLNKSYKNRNNSDFEGILTICNYDYRCKLFVKFNTIQSKICIYKLNVNILNYHKGFCGLDLLYFDNIYENYDENDNLIV